MNQTFTHYHAEVKGSIEGREVRINVFKDDLDAVFLDVGIIVAQLSEATALSLPNSATHPTFADERRARAEATAKAANPPAKPAPKPTPHAQQPGEIPVCKSCGSSEHMELVSFTDKRTGKPAQAWKCQACIAWYWPNKNRKGS